jgi:hypothetical protein
MATKKKAAKKAAKKTTAKKAKHVYYFGAGKCDGDGSMKALLGGKGANLAEMSSIGVPVPAGFTITTEVCTYYYDNAKSILRLLMLKSKQIFPRSRRPWARNLVTLRTPSSFPFAPVLVSRCPG